LGNFAFDLPYPETLPTIILNTSADKSGFYEFEITPVYIDDFIPQRAEGRLGLHILDYLANLSKMMKTYLQVDRENVVARVIMDTLNMEVFETEFYVESELYDQNGSWVTPPIHLENAGSITSVSQIQPTGMYDFRVGRDEIWFGNMEDEGCTLWNLNSADETYCDTVAYTGDRSIQLRRESGAPYNIVTNFEHRIICRSDTLTYSLCGFIKTLNGKGVTIEIQYFDDIENPVPIGEQNLGVTVSGNKPWTFYHRELTIPAGTEYFDVRLNSNVPNSGTSFAWFDNVSLICWEDWIVFDEAKIIPAPNDYYFLQVKSEQNWGDISISYSETVFDEIFTGQIEQNNNPDLDLQLNQNVPNPFNPETGTTLISVFLDAPAEIVLNIFDIKGQRIKLLAKGNLEKGNHDFYWDGRNAAGQWVDSGIYFYELITPVSRQIRKCVVMLK
jgi:hypothetical protein